MDGDVLSFPGVFLLKLVELHPMTITLSAPVSQTKTAKHNKSETGRAANHVVLFVDVNILPHGFFI